MICLRTCGRQFQILIASALAAIGAMTGSLAFGQGFSPADAEKRLQVPAGLTATLFASEPLVRQPIFVKCDGRGRLWTIQYLQYPNPAGLQRVSVDRWSRTVYDRVPEPPPKGPRGADVITVLEDTDGDGRADRPKDVITGLNLCTGLEFGHGGLFVLQVPYLLFYPDRDNDDVPDGDPDVLLAGFGMDDAQSLVNHLTWGPDGWLYGVTGSTSTNRVRDVEFQQGVWRYHPRTKAFELFCEGGSNLFGLTFDARGQMFFSSNGGQLCYHGLQGAYYAKSFGKHGALHNPFAYGWFEEIAKKQPQRGGPTTGGTVYLGAAIPEWQGKFIGGDFLGHTVSAWSLTPDGFTFVADRVGTVLDPRDTWSGPTDNCFGPDGEIYVSDFYDRRTAHPDPDAEWDRSNGRIYRVAPAGVKKSEPFDYHKMTTAELIERLDHPNHWHRRKARLELATRRDPNSVELLMGRLKSDDSQVVLEALWSLAAAGQLDESMSAALVKHESPDVRFWAIRLMGEHWPASQVTAETLRAAGAAETSPNVFVQLLATCERLPPDSATSLLLVIWPRTIQEIDPRLKWPLWWAVETHCVAALDQWGQATSNASQWTHWNTVTIFPLVARRWAAEGTYESYGKIAAMLSTAPDWAEPSLLKAVDQGLAERTRRPVTPMQGDLFATSAQATGVRKDGDVVPAVKPIEGPLGISIRHVWDADPTDAVSASLALQAGVDGAAEAIVRAATDQGIAVLKRVILLESLGRSSTPVSLTVLKPNLVPSSPMPVLLATLQLLARLDNDELTALCLALLRHEQIEVRDAARRVLLSRRTSTERLFEEIDRGRIRVEEIPADDVRAVALFSDPELDAFVRKRWGAIQAGTPEAKLAEMRRLNNDVRAASGDKSRGQALFKQHCAACHKMFGEGTVIGPDLTTTSRADREFLLRSLVDPSAVIRSQYLSTIIATKQGQVLTGLIAQRDNGRIELIDSKAERHVVPLDSIESMKDSNVSLMPEGLLSKLSPQDVRDLFAWLQSNGEGK